MAQFETSEKLDTGLLYRDKQKLYSLTRRTRTETFHITVHLQVFSEHFGELEIWETETLFHSPQGIHSPLILTALASFEVAILLSADCPS